jgi:hypothetical protein
VPCQSHISNIKSFLLVEAEKIDFEINFIQVEDKRLIGILDYIFGYLLFFGRSARLQQPKYFIECTCRIMKNILSRIYKYMHCKLYYTIYK